MNRYVAALVLCAAMLGCGGRSSQRGDAGLDAAGSDATFRWPCSRSVYIEDTPTDLDACGLCVEPFARVPFPHALTVGRAVQMVASKAGLVLVDLWDGTIASLVTTSGEVVPLLEHPYDDPPPDDLIPGQPRAAPVPGTTEVWIVSISTDPFPPPGVDAGVMRRRTDAVLYDLAEDTWEKKAAGHFEGTVFNVAALTNGDLIASTTANEGVVRVRALADGTVELLWKTNDELDLPFSLNPWVYDFIEPLPSGDAVVAIYDLQESWMRVFDSGLAPAGPWSLAGGAADDVAYVAGENPVIYGHKIVHPSNRLFLMLFGTIQGFGAASWQHRFGNWLLYDGTLGLSAPGTWVNMGDYLTTDAVTSWGNPAGFAIGLPGDRAAIVWSDYIAGAISSDQTHAQVVLGDGGVGRTLQFAYEDARTHGRLFGQDGQGNAYLGQRDFDTDPFVLYGLGADVSLLWSTTFQTCPDRIATRDTWVVGAEDEGVWVVWQDEHAESTTGQAVLLLKAALLDPQGNPVW